MVAQKPLQKKVKKTICLCSSVAFYKDLIEIQKSLRKFGFIVVVPSSVRVMEKKGDFSEKNQKTWFNDPSLYHKKTYFMKDHFKKVIKSDGILVINKTKKNIPGYIGGNVLMEMVLAFHFKKPIFIYNPISDKLPIVEEVYGLQPRFIDQDLSKISL